MIASLLAPIFGTIDPGYLGHVSGKYYTNGYGFAEFVANMINLIIIISGIAFFVYFIIGGLRYITAGGDIKQTQEATKQLTSAIIGLAIVVGSYAISRVVSKVLGVDIFHPIFVGP